jgi:YaiO family outer membrane protein
MMRRLAFGTAVALALCAPNLASAQWRERGSEVSIVGDYIGWDEDRPAWREGQFAARHNTRHGAGVIRLSHVERGSFSDNRVELEAYPLFSGGYAALTLGFAGDGNVYARSTMSAEAYGTVGPLESSFGVRRMNFANSLTILTGSLGVYHRDYLFGARVNHVLDAGTLVAMTALRYFESEPEQYIGVQLAAGTVPAEFRTATDLDVMDSRSAALEAQLVFRSRWVLRARAEGGREKLEGRDASMFSAATLGIGVRF